MNNTLWLIMTNLENHLISILMSNESNRMVAVQTMAVQFFAKQCTKLRTDFTDSRIGLFPWNLILYLLWNCTIKNPIMEFLKVKKNMICRLLSTKESPGITLIKILLNKSLASIKPHCKTKFSLLFRAYKRKVKLSWRSNSNIRRKS